MTMRNVPIRNVDYLMLMLILWMVHVVSTTTLPLRETRYSVLPGVSPRQYTRTSELPISSSPVYAPFTKYSYTYGQTYASSSVLSIDPYDSSITGSITQYVSLSSSSVASSDTTIAPTSDVVTSDYHVISSSSDYYFVSPSSSSSSFMGTSEPYTSSYSLGYESSYSSELPIISSPVYVPLTKYSYTYGHTYLSSIDPYDSSITSSITQYVSPSSSSVVSSDTTMAPTSNAVASDYPIISSSSDYYFVSPSSSGLMGTSESYTSSYSLGYESSYSSELTISSSPVYVPFTKYSYTYGHTYVSSIDPYYSSITSSIIQYVSSASSSVATSDPTIASTSDTVTTIASTSDATTTIAPSSDAVTTIAPKSDAVTTIAPTSDIVTTIAPTSDAVTSDYHVISSSSDYYFVSSTSSSCMDSSALYTSLYSLRYESSQSIYLTSNVFPVSGSISKSYTSVHYASSSTSSVISSESSIVCSLTRHVSPTSSVVAQSMPSLSSSITRHVSPTSSGVAQSMPSLSSSTHYAFTTHHPTDSSTTTPPSRVKPDKAEYAMPLLIVLNVTSRTQERDDERLQEEIRLIFRNITGFIRVDFVRDETGHRSNAVYFQVVVDVTVLMRISDLNKLIRSELGRILTRLGRLGLANIGVDTNATSSSFVHAIYVLSELMREPCENTLVTCPRGYQCLAGDNYQLPCVYLCVDDTCSTHGVCAFDQQWQPTCRCTDDEDFVYSGPRCEEEHEKLKLTSGQIIGVATGVGGFLILVLLIALIVTQVRKRKRSNACRRKQYVHKAQIGTDSNKEDLRRTPSGFSMFESPAYIDSDRESTTSPAYIDSGRESPTSPAYIDSERESPTSLGGSDEEQAGYLVLTDDYPYMQISDLAQEHDRPRLPNHFSSLYDNRAPNLQNNDTAGYISPTSVPNHDAPPVPAEYITEWRNKIHIDFKSSRLDFQKQFVSSSGKSESETSDMLSGYSVSNPGSEKRLISDWTDYGHTQF